MDFQVSISEAATKCHASAKTFGQQAVELKNPENCNLPGNNGRVVYKSHDIIGNKRLFCERLPRKRLFLRILKPIPPGGVLNLLIRLLISTLDVTTDLSVPRVSSGAIWASLYSKEEAIAPTKAKAPAIPNCQQRLSQPLFTRLLFSTSYRLRKMSCIKMILMLSCFFSWLEMLALLRV